MSEADIWMPLYIGPYLRRTMALTRDQHGGYLMLLIAYWLNGGPLPDDDNELCSIVKASLKEWPKLRTVLVKYFEVRDGRWHQPRADQEIAKAKANKQARSKAGSKGVANREAKRHAKDKQGIMQDDKQTPMQTTSPLPLPSSVPNGTGETPKDELIDLKAEIFGPILKWTMAHSAQDEKHARSWLGKLCRDFGDGRTVEVLQQAARDGPLDAIAWVEGMLAAEKSNGKTGNGGGQSKGERFARSAYAAVLETSNLGGSGRPQSSG